MQMCARIEMTRRSLSWISTKLEQLVDEIEETMKSADDPLLEAYTNFDHTLA